MRVSARTFPWLKTKSINSNTFILHFISNFCECLLYIENYLLQELCSMRFCFSIWYLVPSTSHTYFMLQYLILLVRAPNDNFSFGLHKLMYALAKWSLLSIEKCFEIIFFILLLIYIWKPNKRYAETYEMRHLAI